MTCPLSPMVQRLSLIRPFLPIFEPCTYTLHTYVRTYVHTQHTSLHAHTYITVTCRHAHHICIPYVFTLYVLTYVHTYICNIHAHMHMYVHTSHDCTQRQPSHLPVPVVCRQQSDRHWSIANLLVERRRNGDWTFFPFNVDPFGWDVKGGSNVQGGTS